MGKKTLIYHGQNIGLHDCNGNVTWLRRGGFTNNMRESYGLVDALRMTYEGNRLVSVRDSVYHIPYAGASDFTGLRGQENPLTYDGAGSLFSDVGRGIARIDYDPRNNPVRIQFTDGSVTKYIYSAAGEKLRVIHQTAVPNISVPVGFIRPLAPSEILSADSTDYLLGGALTLKNGLIDKYLFGEGYCQATVYGSRPGKDAFAFYYYDRDHLGSVREVTRADGSISNGTAYLRTDYYPSGLRLCDGTADSGAQPYKYNGKELDGMHGLCTYDYGARQYDPVTASWDRPDPLCEKYYGISPYAYCGGNPVNRVDIDGRDIVIVGPLANMAIEQLQEKIGNKIQLSLSNDNFLCYNIVGKGHLNKSAKRMIEMIDNHEITVNMTTTDNDKTSTGELLVGGAFMGNNVELDSDGNVVHTTAYQEVNPQVLMKADTYSDNGTSMMHELTEAYEGAKISAENKVSSPKSDEPNSVYKQAHHNATTAPQIYNRSYNANGNVVSERNKGCVKKIYFVKSYNNPQDENIIQTWEPNK